MAENPNKEIYEKLDQARLQSFEYLQETFPDIRKLVDLLLQNCDVGVFCVDQGADKFASIILRLTTHLSLPELHQILLDEKIDIKGIGEVKEIDQYGFYISFYRNSVQIAFTVLQVKDAIAGKLHPCDTDALRSWLSIVRRRKAEARDHSAD